MNQQLQFDESTHTYTLGGMIIPSVTQVLSSVGIVDYSRVPPHVLAEAAERGTAIHRACRFLDENDLDESVLCPWIIPYLEAWKKFKLLHNPGFVLIERPLTACINGMAFAGTPDRVGTMGDIPYIIEIKTGDESMERAWKVQTAAYAMLAPKRRTNPFQYRGASIQLFGDGTYRKSGDYADPKDAQIFLAALAIHVWKTNNSRG
jgi:hypothetical protein